MCFGSPKIPKTPAPLPVEATDDAVVMARDRERRRRALSGGRQSTLLTGAAGAPTNPAGKTLLGQ